MQIVSKGLSFTYNKKTEFNKRALRDVNLTIRDGDFFGIIGHTGSGKSTFIQHLNGLIPVQEGEITVGDITLTATKKKDKKVKENLKLLRSKVGMVFQYPEYQLFAETVFDDVAFGIKNFYPNKTQTEIENDVKSAIERVGLNYYEVKHKSPFDLSGGQKRRVAIAGVLVTNPEVLILDEPVAGLDPVGKKQLMSILHDIHKTTVKTIIIVSHDMDEVLENCNRIAVFNEGVVVSCDSPENLFSSVEKLKALRLDAPVTVKVAQKLQAVGVNLQTDYKIDDFIYAVKKAYLNLK